MEKFKINVVEQNLGMLDRSIRFILGCVMLGVPFYMMTQVGQPAEQLYNWSMLLSIYPFLTAVTGCDVLYKPFHIKSCDLSRRNKCGSFPFELDAWFGRDPVPEDDTEHTLGHSSHKLHQA